MSSVIFANSSLYYSDAYPQVPVSKSVLPSTSFYENTLMLKNMIQKAYLCYLPLNALYFYIVQKQKRPTNKVNTGREKHQVLENRPLEGNFHDGQMKNQSLDI